MAIPLLIESTFIAPLSSAIKQTLNDSRSLVYYSIESLFQIRPMGIFTGKVLTDFGVCRPYHARRSNGSIKIASLDSDKTLAGDVSFFDERPQSMYTQTCSTIIAKDKGKVFVCGEVSGGFCFEADGKIQLVGKLFVGEFGDTGLLETLVEASEVSVEVPEGVAVIVICDFQEVIILKDGASKWQLRVLSPLMTTSWSPDYSIGSNEDNRIGIKSGTGVAVVDPKLTTVSVFLPPLFSLCGESKLAIEFEAKRKQMQVKSASVKSTVKVEANLNFIIPAPKIVAKNTKPSSMLKIAISQQKDLKRTSKKELKTLEPRKKSSLVKNCENKKPQGKKSVI